MTARAQLAREADRILKTANDNKGSGREARYRGGRPALNWLAKSDPAGAAALWFIARQRLPQAANDNRADAAGMGVDRRPSGKPRGRDADPRSLEAYLALPGVQPRLGDAPPESVRLRGWDGEARGVTVKLQRRRGKYPSSVKCAYTICPPAIAYGAIFLGAIGGLGQPRPHSSRGDIRRVDGLDLPKPPEEIDKVIEAVLARATVAGVGEVLGARGCRPDRRGAKALRAAGEWAKVQIVPRGA